MFLLVTGGEFVLHIYTTTNLAVFLVFGVLLMFLESKSVLTAFRKYLSSELIDASSLLCSIPLFLFLFRIFGFVISHILLLVDLYAPTLSTLLPSSFYVFISITWLVDVADLAYFS